MRISFRTAQTGSLLAVLLLTVIILGGSSFLNGSFAVSRLGKLVLQQAGSRIEQYVHSILEMALAQNITDHSLITSGAIDYRDHETMTRWFLASMQARPFLSYVSMGLETGEYWHVFRAGNGALSAQWLLPNATGGFDLIDFDVELDQPGMLRESGRQVNTARQPPYDRPYYQTAKSAGTALWTESYIFLSAGGRYDIPGVTRASPVYSNQGELLGVLTADIDLVALSRFLKGMRLGREGFAFIVENRSDGSRRIIAHPDAPDSLRLTTSASDGRGQDALPAEEIDDPRVHALLPLVPGHDEDSSPGMQTIHASVGPVEYTGGILKLKGSDQPDWLICMMIPEDEILGQIHRMNKLTFLIAFGGVIVSVALGFWLASRMARHLQRVVQETHEIAQFRLMPKEFKPSAIKEIGRLETSFEEMKSGLRSFQKYVPADLVRNILASGQEAKLGGSRRRITVFFSDIASFTKISEQLPPEILIDVLSDYLNQMTQVMLDAGATVDKYIGDAIMAFWGAPHDQTDAALKACYAALGNQHQLIDLRAKWKASGLPEIRARIGLHTGEALVGNFGSENRLDYTAIGDTVNLAHRLEGLNEHYGTDILISEATRLEVGNQFLVRCIDRVAVKGREAGTIIFELIKPLDEADAREIAFCTEFESALNQYFQADFDSAQKAFEEILKQYPDDGPGREMLRRCMLYAENPPPDDWDGIWRMVTK